MSVKPVAFAASPSVLAAPERIHPALWRASQLASSPDLHVDTGYPAMSAELPGGGWPLGNLIEVMIPRAGIGELQLFRPALGGALPGHSGQDNTAPASGCRKAGVRVGPVGGADVRDVRPIVLIQPPYIPQTAGWAGWGVAPSRLLWLQPQARPDALWAAEHILDSAAFSALFLWQDTLREASLRRLQLAAQKGNTLFVLIRSLQAARQSSPAPLRLALHPVRGGLHVHIVKRRGRVLEHPVPVLLYPDPLASAGPFSVESRHASLDRRASAASHAGYPLSRMAH